MRCNAGLGHDPGESRHFASALQKLQKILTLAHAFKADVDQMAKVQKLPVCLVGLGSMFEVTDGKAKVTSCPTRCMKDIVMSQILTATNASLW